MLRLLSLIISCLCLQHAVAQTDSSQSFERFKENFESSLNEELEKLRQPLPNWFTTPSSNEYVGCSFPSNDVNTRHETAILCALLNYMACNYPCNIDMSSLVKYENGVTETTSERAIDFYFNFQLVRTEVVRNHTLVAVKVDTTGTPGFGFSIRMTQHDVSNSDFTDLSGELKLELETTQQDKYSIEHFFSHSEDFGDVVLNLMSERKRIFCSKVGKEVITGDPEERESKIGKMKYQSPLEGDDIGFVFWQAVIDVLCDRAFYPREEVYADNVYVNTHNKLVNGNLKVYFESKTSKRK